MKFSFQTVWIIFGVTLAHLFAISTLLSTGGARQDAVTNAVPAIPSEEKPESAVAVIESAVEPVSEIEPQPHEKSSATASEEQESPPHETMRVETPDPSSTAEADDATMESGIVETDSAGQSPTPADPPALAAPPQRIREIRDLEPVRRS